MSFYVKHRTVTQAPWNGWHTTPLPYQYDGPFGSHEEAEAHWNGIVSYWQEGGVVDAESAARERGLSV